MSNLASTQNLSDFDLLVAHVNATYGAIWKKPIDFNRLISNSEEVVSLDGDSA